MRILSGAYKTKRKMRQVIQFRKEEGKGTVVRRM